MEAKVIRPEFDESGTLDNVVTLTATITHGSASGEFQKQVKVRMQGMTDSKVVELDSKALKDIIPTTTTGPSINLPASGTYGSKITWTTSNPDTITKDGMVTRPAVGEGEVKVNLTATCAKNSATQTETFAITVEPWTVDDEMSDAVARITWDLIKGTNTDSQSIATDLILPTTIGQGVAVQWTSDSSYINVTTGKITRPTYTQGQVTVTLKCELTIGGKTQPVSLPVYIISPLPISDKEAVDAANALLQADSFIDKNASLNEITTDMILPTSIENNEDLKGVTISWSLADSNEKDVASSPYIIISTVNSVLTATIKRPEYGKENQTIQLKATISSKQAVDVDYFPLIILAETDDGTATTNTTPES